MQLLYIKIYCTLLSCLCIVCFVEKGVTKMHTALDSTSKRPNKRHPPHEVGTSYRSAVMPLWYCRAVGERLCYRLVDHLEVTAVILSDMQGVMIAGR